MIYSVIVSGFCQGKKRRILETFLTVIAWNAYSGFIYGSGTSVPHYRGEIPLSSPTDIRRLVDKNKADEVPSLQKQGKYEEEIKKNRG